MRVLRKQFSCNYQDLRPGLYRLLCTLQSSRNYLPILKAQNAQTTCAAAGICSMPTRNLKSAARIGCQPEGIVPSHPMQLESAKLHLQSINQPHLKQNENMVRTDSQDYGADEILYTSKIALFHKTSRFTSGITNLSRGSPQLFQLFFARSLLGERASCSFKYFNGRDARCPSDACPGICADLRIQAIDMRTKYSRGGQLGCF